MAIITSRPVASDENIVRLQEILYHASFGIIGEPNDPYTTVQAGTTMLELLNQTETLFAGMSSAIEQVSVDLNDISIRLTQSEIERNAAQNALTKLIGSIDYDEALDLAASNLMEGFCASVAADVSADGQLIFDERTSFTKEDIKPMLREAIICWIELKIG